MTTNLSADAMVARQAPQLMIREAVLALAARCNYASTEDGRGFNKWDTDFGHRTADKLEAGQPIDFARALKVISKYRKQLSNYGLSLPTPEDLLAALPKPEAKPMGAAQAAGAQATTLEKLPSGSIALRFPYDPARVELARSIPNRRFDGPTKAWIFAAEHLAKAQQLFPDALLLGDLGEALEASKKAAEIAERARLEQLAADLKAFEGIKPSGLFEHQEYGIRWLIEQRFAILADDMGLGKTRQALVAAKALQRAAADRHPYIFVVGPAGLRINWQREAAAVDCRIEFFSWAKVPEPIDRPFILIGDESHYAQNMKAQRTKRFLALAEKAEAVFALTGTPIKNGRPVNLFPLLKAIRHELAKSRKAYEIRYCNAGPTRWSQWDTTGAAHLDELHEKIADAVLRRMKSECLDLPEKTRVIREAELSLEASQRYAKALSDMQSEYQRRVAAGEIEEADALVMMNHVRHASSLAKVETAIEISEEIIEQGGQVVLFTAFKDSAQQIRDKLNGGLISGDISAEDRQEEIDRFQAGEIKAIICTLGAGNVGITLTAAQTVILVDRPWTPGDAIQAEDRCHRIGQRNAVTAIWLQANGSDKVIDALLDEKQERIELVLAGKAKKLAKITSIRAVAEAVLGA